MLIHDLISKGLIHPPDWLADNCMYLTIMGSIAYGTNTEDSDWDIYGFCMPPKHVVFPHLDGEILGFGRTKTRFEQFNTQKTIEDVQKGRNYDLTIYNIVKYFHLCMENNPNMLDSMFTPVECIIHITGVGQKLRENRRLFLHKGCYPKFKNYAYAQLNKMSSKNREGKRKEIVDKYGWDLKFGMHLVRLLGECEQILSTGDLDLRKDNERLKAIRRGEWTEQQVREFFTTKELHLEELYHKSELPYSPNEFKIKELLLNCLEMHYGSLDKCIVREDEAVRALRNISENLNKVKHLL